MNKKSLILAIMLVLIVFLGTSAVSAEESADADYNALEVPQDVDVATSSEVTVETTDTNDQIQAKINSLNDGDTLNFQEGEYNDICLYVNKSITINGNGATLKGYDNPTADMIPDIIMNKTTAGGYGITNKATLYILKTDGLVLKNIKFVAGANSATTKGKTAEGLDDPKYSNCVIYNYFSNHTQITDISVTGCSWGIWFQNCADGIIENNKVQNQGITGIFNFQSPRTIIRNNTVTNAKNHGIDVRHGVGPNVKVLNNTVIGSKEGIYLLHSAKHVLTGNTIINCTLSSITCCGASHITIEGNKLYNSRIGVLLGGGQPVGGAYTGYNNITIGTNEWKLDSLPFPPSFCYYVAEAKGDYASLESMMGTYTDSSKSNETYIEFTGIDVPEPIVIDYDSKLKPTGTVKTITSGMTSAQIQEVINGMNDGDTLVFEENAVFENITIYIEKSIKVIGNNATLISYASPSLDLIPERIRNTTAQGGFGVSYSAVLYCVNASNIVVSNLNIKAIYPGYETITNQNQREYCTAGIYSILSPNLTITNCNVQGASWGMFIGERQQGRPNAIITNNKVSNQYTTGILCFGSANSIIANNTVTNAVNHGIDVRFNQGKNVTIFNNTITGSKDGIYLLHSFGHKVYGNTIKQSKISSITCYGAHDIEIFDNNMMGSRIAIMLGGNGGLNPYYNITIGKNSFTPDKLPFPPTFEFFLVQSESRYYPNDANPTPYEGTYQDSQAVNLIAPDVTVGYKKGALEITLKDNKGKAIANKSGTVTIGTQVIPFTTDANGTASVPLSLTTGNYTASVHTSSNYYYKAGNAQSAIKVDDDRAASALTAPAKTVYLLVIAKGINYQVALKSNGKALAGKDVTINFNGKTITAKTNANGVATFKITAKAIGSKYATVTFKGDDAYKPTTAKALIKTIKEPTKFVAKTKVAFKANVKVKNYIVTLKSKRNAPVAKALVTIKVNGVTYKAYTNAKGVAIFKINKLTKVGNHRAVVRFAGNAYYNPVLLKPLISVKK